MLKNREPRSIDELAYLYLNRKYAFAGMVTKFGWAKSTEAVHRIAQTILLIEPNHHKARQYSPAKLDKYFNLDSF